MLFRPEEVHGTSGKGQVFPPFPTGNRYMPDQSFGITGQNFPIPDLHPDRFATIETGGVYLDCFAWEKPADRQRFESSLAKPLLLTINGDSVLIGQVVEGGH